MRTEVYDESLGTWQHVPAFDIPGDAEHEDGKFCWETPDGGIVYLEIESAKVCKLILSLWFTPINMMLNLSFSSLDPSLERWHHY